MDKYTQIEKLNQLKERGTITEEQYESEKGKILSYTLADVETVEPARTKKESVVGVIGFMLAVITLLLGLITNSLGVIMILTIPILATLILTIIGVTLPSTRYKRTLSIIGLVMIGIVIVKLVAVLVLFQGRNPFNHRDTSTPIERGVMDN